MRAQLGHDGLCRLLRSLPDILARVSVAHEKVREYVDDVWLKKTTEPHAQQLVRHERTLTMPRVLLVGYSLFELVCEPVLLKCQNAQAFHNASNAIPTQPTT